MFLWGYIHTYIHTYIFVKNIHITHIKYKPSLSVRTRGALKRVTWALKSASNAHYCATRTQAPRAIGWAKLQKLAKNEIQKIREIDRSYLCLQRFDKIWMWSVGNQKRKLCQFAATCMEKLVKSLVLNLFLVSFNQLKPLCAIGWSVKWILAYLERGRNMDPSMNTAPDRRMYQQEAISPRLHRRK